MYKIMHVTQSMGGVKTYIKSILTFSSKNAFVHVVIAPYDEELEAFCRKLGIKYYAITFKREFSLVHDITALFKTARVIRKEKPHLVHCHSAKGGFIGRLAATICLKKTVYTPNGFSYLSFTGVKRSFFFLLEVVAKRWTSLLLAVSYSEANRAIFELGYKKSKANVVLNAIDVEEKVMERTANEKVRRVGTIARLTNQKDPLLFLEVAKTITSQHRDIVFAILGAGLHDHLAKEVNAFIKQNNLEKCIQIVSWGDDSTAINFLKGLDVFVMTSVFEGLPYSLLEAMEIGIPCVVSKADGNCDVIQNRENGFACMTHTEYCSKINMLIESVDLRNSLTKSGREYVALHHNMKNAIRQLEPLYINLIVKE